MKHWRCTFGRWLRCDALPSTGVEVVTVSDLEIASAPLEAVQHWQRLAELYSPEPVPYSLFSRLLLVANRLGLEGKQIQEIVEWPDMEARTRQIGFRWERAR